MFPTEIPLNKSENTIDKVDTIVEDEPENKTIDEHDAEKDMDVDSSLDSDDEKDNQQTLSRSHSPVIGVIPTISIRMKSNPSGDGTNTEYGISIPPIKKKKEDRKSEDCSTKDKHRDKHHKDKKKKKKKHKNKHKHKHKHHSSDL